jgi:hypothetical protein
LVEAAEETLMCVQGHSRRFGMSVTYALTERAQRPIGGVNELLVPALVCCNPERIGDMSVTKEEKTVTVEKRSGSTDVNATVTENGKSGSAKGATAEEALGRAKDQAKG